jgi:hypothetical protein
MLMRELFGEDYLEVLLLSVLVEACSGENGLLDSRGVPAYELAFEDLEYYLAMRKVEGRTVARLRKAGRAALRALANKQPQLGEPLLAAMTRGERSTASLSIVD